MSAGPDHQAGLCARAAIEWVLEQIIQRDGMNDGKVMARIRERAALLGIREAAVAAREAVLAADTAALQAREAVLPHREKQLAEDEADREQWHLVERERLPGISWGSQISPIYLFYVVSVFCETQQALLCLPVSPGLGTTILYIRSLLDTGILVNL